jgi:hypothetical protein
VPLILDNVRAFEIWAETKPVDLVEPSRGVGLQETALGADLCYHAAMVDKVKKPKVVRTQQESEDTTRPVNPDEDDALLLAGGLAVLPMLFRRRPPSRTRPRS